MRQPIISSSIWVDKYLKIIGSLPFHLKLIDVALCIFHVPILLDYLYILPVEDRAPQQLLAGVYRTTNMLPHANLDGIVKFHRVVFGIEKLILEGVTEQVAFRVLLNGEKLLAVFGDGKKWASLLVFRGFFEPEFDCEISVWSRDFEIKTRWSMVLGQLEVEELFALFLAWDTIPFSVPGEGGVVEDLAYFVSWQLK